jgi:hypothetical protein
MRSAVLALLVVAAGCAGEEGTIQFELVTAPGSDLLDRVQRARLTLSNPTQVVEAERDGDGQLSLSLQVVAEGQSGTARLEGFDAGGELIALGLSPALPVAAVDAAIALYVAPPLSFAEAPIELEPARSEAAGALLPYGALLAGGRDADGDPITSLVIYNVYDHGLQIGLDLPEARAQMTVLTGPSDFVYLFGGLDDEGAPSADAWRFDTRVSPAGLHAPLISDDDLARAGAAGAYAGQESFFIAGDPAARLDAGRVTAIEDGVPAAGAAVATIDSITAAQPVLVVGAGVGSTGAALYQSGVLREIDAPPELQRTGHALVPLPDGRLLALGGSDPEGSLLDSGVVYDPATAAFTVVDDLLDEPRAGAAIAVTSDVVIVAGGTDAAGTARADAEILDATDLDRVATLALGTERVGGVALALGNRQVLLASGTTAAGEPIARLELFTPAE